MSTPTYNPRCLKQLESIDRYALSPNHKSLAENIDLILTKGPEFTPDKIDEYKEIMDLLEAIMRAYIDYQNDPGSSGDMLGDYLEQSNQTNARTGQFFTPMSICRMQAAMILTDEVMTRRQPVTILDPACGSGRYMIALHDHYLAKNICPNFIFYGVDIDYNAFNLCVMNAILHHIPAVIIHGDSLNMEYHRGYAVLPLKTPTGYVEWSPLSSDQALAVMLHQTPGETTNEKEDMLKTVAAAAKTTRQLTLFET